MSGSAAWVQCLVLSCGLGIRADSLGPRVRQHERLWSICEVRPLEAHMGRSTVADGDVLSRNLCLYLASSSCRRLVLERTYH